MSTIPSGVLFSPGERLGWEFRDRFQFKRDVTIPRPMEANVRAHLIEDAARRRKKERGARIWILTGVGLIGWLINWLGADEAEARLLEATSLARRFEVDWMMRQRMAIEAEDARVDAIPEWGAVRTPPGSMRIDIYGGTDRGWRDLMSTLGTSLIGSSSRTTVVDLTGGVVGLELCELTRASGRRSTEFALPRDLPRIDLLAGLNASDATKELVAVMHGLNADNQSDRILTDRLIRDICEVLAPNLSIERLHEATRIVMKEPEPATRLTIDECAAVNGLFGDVYRLQAHTRLRDIEAKFRQLRKLGTEADPLAPKADLTYVNLSYESDSAVRDLQVQVVLQWATQNLRASTGQSLIPTLILLGADVIQGARAERLSDLCAQRGVRLVQFFRHLRGSATESLGGAETTVFMRMGNPDEAERAAQYIGGQHTFVVATLTKSMSETESHSTNQSEGGSSSHTYGQSRGPLALFAGENASGSDVRTWGKTNTIGETSGFTHGESQQRVYELVVRRQELQGLPNNAILLVRHRPDGLVETRFADCNPDIASLPRVSPRAFDEPYVAELISPPELPSLPSSKSLRVLKLTCADAGGVMNLSWEPPVYDPDERELRGYEVYIREANPPSRATVTTLSPATCQILALAQAAGRSYGVQPVWSMPSGAIVYGPERACEDAPDDQPAPVVKDYGVSKLEGSVANGIVNLHWGPPLEQPDDRTLSGYEVFYREASGSRTAVVTLPSNRTDIFALTEMAGRIYGVRPVWRGPSGDIDYGPERMRSISTA